MEVGREEEKHIIIFLMRSWIFFAENFALIIHCRDVKIFTSDVMN